MSSRLLPRLLRRLLKLLLAAALLSALLVLSLRWIPPVGSALMVERKIESWLDEVRCSGCYEYIEKGDSVYHGSYCRLCVQEADAMSMEKRGVVSNENEEPKNEAQPKAASDDTACQTQCCGQKSCGSDLTSKLSDEVANKK